jgi:hypothetical protein
MKLQQRSVFTESECTLVSGKPLELGDQDDYEEDLMRLEDREIKFWISVNKTPNFIDDADWSLLTEDYIERMRIAKEEGIKEEKKEVLNLLKRMETSDYHKMINYNKLPLRLEAVIEVTKEHLVSIKWGEPLFKSIVLFDYEDDANQRALWYDSVERGADNMFEMWLDYKAEMEAMSGETIEKELRDLGSTIYNEEVHKEYEGYMNEEFPPSEDKISIADDGDDWNF